MCVSSVGETSSVSRGASTRGPFGASSLTPNSPSPCLCTHCPVSPFIYLPELICTDAHCSPSYICGFFSPFTFSFTMSAEMAPFQLVWKSLGIRDWLLPPLSSPLIPNTELSAFIRALESPGYQKASWPYTQGCCGEHSKERLVQGMRGQCFPTGPLELT